MPRSSHTLDVLMNIIRITHILPISLFSYQKSSLIPRLLAACAFLCPDLPLLLTSLIISFDFKYPPQLCFFLSEILPNSWSQSCKRPLQLLCFAQRPGMYICVYMCIDAQRPGMHRFALLCSTAGNVRYLYMCIYVYRCSTAGNASLCFALLNGRECIYVYICV